MLEELAKKFPEGFFENQGKIYFRMLTKIDEQGEYFITNAGDAVEHYHRDADYITYLRPWKDTKGYDTVKIHGKNVRVHQLVAQQFVPNPQNLPEVHHIDGDKSNNCFCNLEWCTRAEHNAKHGKPVVALDKETKELVFTFQTAAEAERETGIPATGIRDCCKKRYRTYRGYIWMYVSEYEAMQNE
ncbi:HNH endonuclease [Agathobaculum sp. Marseille-P7918]|uniref:HNH endonuclease n=1 Tax=Agathobaculum sp. Marseille-P7918 TaxID=2479843 RepID=UPI001FAA9BB7|nr:HNH endonuclease [Agathobaculum sp. Marseille-P7918]